jgi:hypothetical protein
MACQNRNPAVGDGRASKTFSSTTERLEATPNSHRFQDAPSPEAVSAARDVAFEAIVETASLGESYARSLSEAAWRGDRTTVELHIRQWRSCLLAAIDAFKQLDVVAAKGGVA